MLTYTVEPFGISYIPYTSALVVACGMPNGTAGRHLLRTIARVSMGAGSGGKKGLT